MIEPMPPAAPTRTRPRPLTLATALAAVAATSVVLTSCAASTAGTPATGDAGAVSVLASFYPLEYVAQQVGGETVTVRSLTPPGAEPHDLELSPSQVRTVGEADLVLYLSEFQAAVDEAVAAKPGARVLDARSVMPTADEGPQDTHEGESEAEHAEHEHEKTEADHADDEGHDHDHGADPHFWLDPTLLAALAGPVAEALGEADPAHAADYAARGEALEQQLTELDAAFTDGLATCERRTILVTHEAYGFLADRYGLNQAGLAGLDPDVEPSVARLREIRAIAEASDATTIFTESLVDARAAEQLAADLGLTTATLDPVENQADPAQDYRQVMTSNLGALRLALDCA